MRTNENSLFSLVRLRLFIYPCSVQYVIATDTTACSIRDNQMKSQYFDSMHSIIMRNPSPNLIGFISKFTHIN